jgi:hypothetical protein
LVRNFEIAAESRAEDGQMRATALLIYLMPALAVNASFLWLVSRALGLPAIAVTGASVFAGVYGVVVLCSLLFLSLAGVNDFARVVGAPQSGFLVSVVGCALLISGGMLRGRPASP